MNPMRRIVAAPTGLAVFLAFFAAPFLHLHTAEAGDHHHDEPSGHARAAIVHVHLPGSHAAEHGHTDLTEPEEHDLSLSVFAALVKQQALPALPVLLAARAEAEPPAVSSESFVLLCPPHAHDPPALDSAQPRAPPA
jgi:hypothetical protein